MQFESKICLWRMLNLTKLLSSKRDNIYSTTDVLQIIKMTLKDAALKLTLM